MRSMWRTRRVVAAGQHVDRKLVRDIALVWLADGMVGISFGAIAVSAGLPMWIPMLLSLLVFAGAAQFMFVGIVASGGNPIAAVVAGLLVNARHLPFGFSVSDVFGDSWASRIVGSHLMIDESVAFALAQREPRRRRLAYWLSGAGLFCSWNVGVVAGAFVGRAIANTDAFGLDAAFPSVLLALVLPSLRDAKVRGVAILGSAVALATSPFLLAGLPVLLSLVGVLFSLRDKRFSVNETSESEAGT
ncbi:MAG: AzlC family ABC transporter permease [Sciscionella sp.]|nr:AzlC family ABC transporter permease [Sciscionella sp.]